jgi:hypothetical protein
MNPTPNEQRQCRHRGHHKCAPIHGPGDVGNVDALCRQDGQMNRQGWSGVQGGHLHGGTVPRQLNRGAGGSYFFGVHGGRGCAAVPPPPPRGAPRVMVRRGGGAAKDCRLQRKRGQERTMSRKGSERGNISGNNIGEIGEIYLLLTFGFQITTRRIFYFYTYSPFCNQSQCHT